MAKSMAYNNDGVKISEWDYRKGKLHGKIVEFYPDGSKRYECGYKNEERHGKEISYNEDGSIKSKETYKNGIKNNDRSSSNSIGEKMENWVEKMMSFVNGFVKGLRKDIGEDKKSENKSEETVASIINSENKNNTPRETFKMLIGVPKGDTHIEKTPDEYGVKLSEAMMKAHKYRKALDQKQKKSKGFKM